MGAVQTVAIVCPEDETRFWNINAADFDPKTHVRWDERPAKKPAKPAKKQAPKPTRTANDASGKKSAARRARRG